MIYKIIIIRCGNLYRQFCIKSEKKITKANELLRTIAKYGHINVTVYQTNKKDKQTYGKYRDLKKLVQNLCMYSGYAQMSMPHSESVVNRTVQDLMACSGVKEDWAGRYRAHRTINNGDRVIVDLTPRYYLLIPKFDDVVASGDNLDRPLSDLFKEAGFTWFEAGRDNGDGDAEMAEYDGFAHPNGGEFYAIHDHGTFVDYYSWCYNSHGSTHVHRLSSDKLRGRLVLIANIVDEHFDMPWFDTMLEDLFKVMILSDDTKTGDLATW